MSFTTKFSLSLLILIISSAGVHSAVIYDESFVVASNSAPSVVGWEGWFMTTQTGTGTVTDSTATNSGVFVNADDFMAQYNNGSARAAYFTNAATTAAINATSGFAGDVTKLTEIGFRYGNQSTNITMHFLINVDTGSENEWWVSQTSHSSTVGTSAGDFVSGTNEEFATIQPLQANAWRLLGDINFTDTLGDINTFGAARTLSASHSIEAFGVWSQKPSANANTRFDDYTITVIPEPGTLALFGLAGIAALAGLRRRK